MTSSAFSHSSHAASGICDGHSIAAMASVVRRCSLALQAALVDAVLPAVSATVRHFEAAFTTTKDLDPAVRKALRRRARRSMAQQPGEELDTMFKARCSKSFENIKGLGLYTSR